jgi:hypothetical protein
LQVIPYLIFSLFAVTISLSTNALEAQYIEFFGTFNSEKTEDIAITLPYFFQSS